MHGGVAPGAGGIDEAMERALASRPEASALACVDADTGMMLASAARHEDALDVVATGAALAHVLGAPPPVVAGDPDEPGATADRSLVVTRRWVQVHERVPGRPSLFVVGVGAADANIGLLASCVRDVSSLLGAIR